MSLKAFHIVFITLAVLLILGCGAGALYLYMQNGGWLSLAMTILSFAAAVLLIVYEIWFIKKARSGF